MKEKIFYLGVGMLFTHELDAMTNYEWRVLPLTSWIQEQYGEAVFVLLHIPMFAILVGLVASQNRKIRNRSMLGISVFMVVHALLHVAFSNHQHYLFESILSNFLIFGTAVCGLVYLLMLKVNNAGVAK